MGDIVEFGLPQASWTDVFNGNLSVGNKGTKKTICVADQIVFVRVDPESRLPTPHGKTEAEIKEQTDKELATLNIDNA